MIYVQVKLDVNGDVIDHLRCQTSALQSPRYDAVWILSQFDSWLAEWRSRPRLPKPYEYEQVERACEEYISSTFATNSGRMNLIRKESTKWLNDAVKYAQPLAMWRAVVEWQNTVFSLYINYRYAGIAPDFDSLPDKPHGYLQIMQAEIDAEA